MSVQDVLTSLRQQRAKVRASGKVQWYAQCPAHDDHEPSLSITQRPDGGVLLKCHRGCETEDVVAALGLQWADLFPPRVELGRPRVTRYPVNGAIHAREDYIGKDGEPRKKVWWEGHDGKGAQEMPLYNAGALADVPQGARVILTEGEKACEALIRAEIPAVATVTGAAGMPSDDALRALQGYDVWLWPDNDDAGRTHMQRIAARLEQIGIAVKWIDWRDAPDKGDAADYFAAGWTVAGIAQLMRDDSENEATRYEENAKKADDRDNAFNSYFVDASPYPTPDPAIYYGLAGDIVAVIEPQSEADPVALLVQLLAAVGNAAGRHAYITAEADRHYPNLFAVLVGNTSKGRKGTSWGHVERIMASAVPAWAADHILPGGLSSGEGIIHALRDVGDGEEITERGTAAIVLTDKRLFVQEGEFASVLRMFTRDSNILSAVLRQAWDGRALQTLTKHSPERASNTHISIVGHITRAELLRYLSQTDAANGVGNRFLWVCSRRSKELPFGGDIDELARALAPLQEKLRTAIEKAKNAGRMRFDAQACALWVAAYGRLSDGKPGLLGSMTARAEAQVLRLALLYAILDCSAMIGAAHLRAALALWDYIEASACYIFGDSLGDPIADKILHALREAGDDGLSRTDIYALFGRNVKAKTIAGALRALLDARLARFTVKHPDKQGRPTERWFAMQVQSRSTQETQETREGIPA